jgi:hypothetical protein
MLSEELTGEAGRRALPVLDKKHKTKGLLVQGSVGNTKETGCRRVFLDGVARERTKQEAYGGGNGACV